ncbi:MAG: hypothetical protein WKG07_39770 [Hymenobacter sp.]
MAAVATDVTAQVLARQQVAQANDLLHGRQPAAYPHQHRPRQLYLHRLPRPEGTPSATSRGWSLAVREELARPPAEADIRPLLHLMQDSVDRFKRTIAQLTDIVKLQEAHAATPAAVDLAALVEEVSQDLSPEF